MRTITPVIISGLCALFLFNAALANDPSTDWANLQRYQHSSQSLAATKTVRGRVVFMGDSITEFWGDTDPAFMDGQKHINRGISGQTTPQMVLRFKQDVIDLHPEVVVILAGTNDIAGNTGPVTVAQIMDNLIMMMQLAEANHIKVIIASVLPADHYSWNSSIKPAEIIQDLNQKIKSYAIEHNMTYLDWYHSLSTPTGGLESQYGPDGVHPNLVGYQLMESMINPILKSVLKQ